MRFFMIIIASVVLWGCQEVPPEHIFLLDEIKKSDVIKIIGKKQDNCLSIKNQAFVDLTLAIKNKDLNDKVKKFATKLIVFLENKVVPVLETNQAVNRDVTVKKSVTMFNVMQKQTWAKVLSEEEATFLLNSLKPSFEYIGFPGLLEENKLLGDDDGTIASLLCFLEGVEDALKLYYDSNRYEALQEKGAKKTTK